MGSSIAVLFAINLSQFPFRLIEILPVESVEWAFLDLGLRLEEKSSFATMKSS
jgi:hypothetical protein